MFDSVSEIFSITNGKLLFGGIQIIFCGDFRQLPPVPKLYARRMVTIVSRIIYFKVYYPTD
jgi:hypothetical protein